MIGSFLLKKFVQKLAVLFIVMTLVFLIPRLAPGSPIDYLVEDPRIPGEVKEELLRKFGLDRPIFPDQYLDFLRNVMLRGDFGYSFMYQRPVFDVIMERLPWTILLLGTALAISATLGTFAGIFAAWFRGGKKDYVVTLTALFLRSLPVFWTGMILLLAFSYYLNIFPMGGATTAGTEYSGFLDYVADVLWHLTLPLLAIIPIFTARYLLVMRNTMVDIIREDFVITAVAKGLEDRQVMLGHVARNALLPLTTMLAIDVGVMMGGAVITETVFSYPGVGSLIYDAVMNHDYPLILGAFFIVSVVTLVATTVAELLYAFLDPRVRMGEA